MFRIIKYTCPSLYNIILPVVDKLLHSTFTMYVIEMTYVFGKQLFDPIFVLCSKQLLRLRVLWHSGVLTQNRPFGLHTWIPARSGTPKRRMLLGRLSDVDQMVVFAFVPNESTYFPTKNTFSNFTLCKWVIMRFIVRHEFYDHVFWLRGLLALFASPLDARTLPKSK